jgi:hypothetical protein
MLLTQFALTIYFNSAFETLSPEILLYWLKRYNPTLKGAITVVSVKAYPPGHARHGARIVSFEGDHDFLDSLYRHHRDYVFRIKFGGNLYIKGGDRIDKDDPRGVKSKGVRMTRSSVRQLLAGSQDKIVEERKADIEANQQSKVCRVCKPTLIFLVTPGALTRKPRSRYAN